MSAERVYALELHSEFVYKYTGGSGLNVLIMKLLPVLCRPLYRMHSSRSRVIALWRCSYTVLYLEFEGNE